ncbi:hypothetical protein [Burkholderia sp. ISTR5]|uniref:hypothetical protein n=1 Tax=Burkholderia sp. ISTR5 TaxID=2500161 RepID=UPI00136B02F1|nr:hypothetical protein [Burkholderia sp. ISTR5]NBI44947.1 hypothetical protein [Burkholderia sp. ISTR5]
MSESKQQWTPGPWTEEGFDQIHAQVATHGHFYGAMIIGADGETIVAQCVMPHNMPALKATPDLIEALQVTTRAASDTLFVLQEILRNDGGADLRFENLAAALDKATDVGYAALAKAGA